MPLRSTRRTHAARPVHTTRTTKKPSLLTRLRGPRRTSPRTKRTHPVTTTTTTTTTKRTTHAAHAAPVHHHRRKASLGDKISGGLMKLRGTLTGRPGVKAAGTRRMHGTDGRGARY